MLGPTQYGVLSVALAVAVTIEWLIIVLFSRAAVQVVAKTDDWRPVAAASAAVFLTLIVIRGMMIG